MKIAILQINPVIGDLQGNARAVLAAAREATAQGADLCVSSELALCGHPPTDLLLRDEFITRCADALQRMAGEIARDSLTPVLVGAPVANPVSQGKTVHNCAVLLRDGRVEVASRKVLLPCEDTLDDMRYFEPGVACGIVQHKGWRLAVTIGEDLWNDRTFWQGRRTYEVDPVAEFMTGGADALLNLTAIPYSLGGAAQHERMLTWTAVRYRIPVLCVNQVGGNDGLLYQGGSVHIDALGSVCARAGSFCEDMRLVDLVTTLPSEHSTQLFHSPEEELWQALVAGTADFVRKCGFSQVVLGLSGGIDSALVAAIATEALGPDNVLGVLMPSPYTSAESSRSALQLADTLGIATRTIPIDALMNCYETALQPLFAGTPSGLTEENIQARIRGGLLMAISNKFGHMLLNTGNKSELAVGYCTLYGDMCGGLGVIGDLYKTQVYALSRWLNAHKGQACIPQEIIEKAPSAELRPNQCDQDSLPPYDVLDRLLSDAIERGMGYATLCQLGYDDAMVRHVLGLVHRAEFKRHQAPPVIAVSPRSFGKEWRMPIAVTPPTPV